MSSFIAVMMLVAAPTLAAGGQYMGYYSGRDIMYPYGDTFCEHGQDKGPCYGTIIYTPRSAPLPATHTNCVWADKSFKWYVWKPRVLSAEQSKYLGTNRVCFIEDRGPARRLNGIKPHELP